MPCAQEKVGSLCEALADVCGEGVIALSVQVRRHRLHARAATDASPEYIEDEPQRIYCHNVAVNSGKRHLRLLRQHQPDAAERDDKCFP
eukprot:CAMPEP_0170137728 /NCGR_PEP_ID=MMETSP0033_2-20121228/4376_1 /TAXON_ID=195969 /ORGANISM="Dolichomastix tenuilepis, Strain CCMP3274" /LENGTH=88 /DNA_ID=CAMNT_0010373623 /DNA_START=65 /DNA_END=331 /DNA_ORIENTATION=-